MIRCSGPVCPHSTHRQPSEGRAEQVMIHAHMPSFREGRGTHNAATKKVTAKMRGGAGRQDWAGEAADGSRHNATTVPVSALHFRSVGVVHSLSLARSLECLPSV